jgi:ABC-type nitrate/sulfonate/bicarbonate transport system permease component
VLYLTLTETRTLDPVFFPPVEKLWDSWQGIWPAFPEGLASSVFMTLTGFAIGTVIGVAMGLVMAYSRVLRDLFGGVFDFLRPVPIFALIPLFILWFGLGQQPQIALIALGTSTILGVTTIEAIRNVATVHVRAALTLGATRGQVYRTVVVPSISPHMLGAIRLAAAASWGLDVAAEFMGAQSGLGYIMINRQQYLDIAGIIDIVIVYSCLAVILDQVIQRLEHPFTKWTERRVQRGVVASMIGNA